MVRNFNAFSFVLLAHAKSVVLASTRKPGCVLCVPDVRCGNPSRRGTHGDVWYGSGRRLKDMDRMNSPISQAPLLTKKIDDVSLPASNASDSADDSETELVVIAGAARSSIDKGEESGQGELTDDDDSDACKATLLAARFSARSTAWHEKERRRLLRRVDARLLPPLVGMYMLNFLDRSNLAQARQGGGLERDLGMTDTDFNLATSVLFVGYLLMQLPSNLAMARVARPGGYLAAAMALWGALSACSAAAQDLAGLASARFCLGFVEAPFFPGAVLLMSSWYTGAELTRRIAWFYSGNALANMFGGLLAAAILGTLDGWLGIAGWRWLFIIVSLIKGPSTTFVLRTCSYKFN